MTLLGLVLLLGLVSGDARPSPVAPAAVVLPADRVVPLWVRGRVSVVFGESMPLSPVLLGVPLPVGAQIELAAGARVNAWLKGGGLWTATGPAVWHVEERGLTPDPYTVTSAYRVVGAPHVYEGALEPDVSYRNYRTFNNRSLPPALIWLQPSAPALVTDNPLLQWHWPYEGGRFDLVVERLGSADGAPAEVIERWHNLTGRTHALWAPLERGARYRLTISHHSERLETPIADQRWVTVLDVADVAALEGARALLRRARAQARGHRPELAVLEAWILETYGLWPEAEIAWTLLAVQHPDREELLQHALRLHAQRVSGRSSGEPF